ncbi:hypothetical protein A3A93_05170 [Candidatus Roizmanbacteria bacterium RIFCSPLOWO2_01_FULL_38_12]|uniref:LysM domain-containing protein n=1 Tax=Candidatus Roizmanbacteria bacterium RIFCSPLOWO2_01_FULL_38_12 TaxID=1802061 RepID=A0A1F7IQY7_9BACT|nr:MAG: hypothetical protein A2861_03275 [Candidatus Roizmanbacteria bacterium RIFCSPHIGHO2_01_FULL_38_15]OGK35983.1 MAG: hypothetical protein A3F59_05365 [Candidatus Roizmanbacteria bacterium RIFCSPHIGHO2_12_FULL_38_13]OGK45780.1 MAG: hypothetical protein A3A93_05170 [Candidatus Roizmanbacteria bacterium RIFCSPLOWO2_01_FULL_38_12]
MNEKKRNARHLIHPFHFTFLTFLPVFIIIFGALFLFALNKANEDQKYFGRLLRGLQDPNVRQTVINYRVSEFDTLETIAKKFDISVDTIIWSNEIQEEEPIVESIITIPPVTGVVHIVEPGETVETIAKFYKVNPQNIYNYPFNVFSVDPAFPITVGQILIVPDGRKDSKTDNIEEYKNNINRL